MDENDKIYTYALHRLNSGYSVYIGFRKSCIDCPYNWESRENVTYTNWNQIKPEPNDKKYDCAQMRLASDVAGQGMSHNFSDKCKIVNFNRYQHDILNFREWYDMDCDYNYRAICQFKTTGGRPAPKPTLPAKDGCKPGWWKFAGYCYAVFGYEDVDDHNLLNTPSSLHTDLSKVDLTLTSSLYFFARLVNVGLLTKISNFHLPN